MGDGLLLASVSKQINCGGNKGNSSFFDGDKGGAVSPFIPKNEVLCISVTNNKK